MTESPPDRVTFSLPSSSELDLDELDDLVARSEHETRSEYIRAAIEAARD